MAIALGMLTALFWGGSSLVGAPGARLLGPIPSLVWIELTGLALVLPLALAGGVPDAPRAAWLAAAASGLTYVLGGGLWNLGVTRGDVGLVTMLISTDGAVAVVLAIAFGEQVGGAVIVPLLLITLGVVLAAGRGHVQADRVAVWAGLGGALAFGCTFVAGGHAVALPTVWVLLVARATGCAVLVPFAAVRGHIRSPRGAVMSVAGMATLDVAGYGTYILGARDGIAVAAVLASQYSLVATVGGRFLFGERLSRLQTCGVALTLIGVALVAWTSGL